jgi:transcriptional regulator with XRE-family HTH domain
MNRTERVIETAHKSGLKDIDFARRIGATKQQFANWKSGSQGVPEKYILKIIEEFPTVNARWLDTGEPQTQINNHNPDELAELKNTIIKDKDTIIALQNKLIDLLTV